MKATPAPARGAVKPAKPRSGKRIAVLATWLEKATKAQRAVLASRAGTKPNQLYQLAGGHRAASSAAALRIERASILFVKDGLPLLAREALARESCGKCEFAKRCRNEP